MHLIIIQLQGKALWFRVNFQVSKILTQSISFIGRSHNDTRINACNVSSFNRRQRSLFTQFCLENPHSHIVVLAKPKLQLLPSRSCCRVEIARDAEIWKCLLECQEWSRTTIFICKLQLMYFLTCSFWRGLRCDWWKFYSVHFGKCPYKTTRLSRPKWYLIGVEAFNIEQWFGSINV